VRILLDTHAFLWFFGGDPKLSVAARSTIEDSNNDNFLSVASLWEIAIKTSLGKLSLQGSFERVIAQALADVDAGLIPIELDHLSEVAGLPFHHRDPFDRLLIAQAKSEQMPLVSADSSFDPYGVRRIW
jgi:PIN domain nuclease of toxin-antitoxin system